MFYLPMNLLVKNTVQQASPNKVTEDIQNRSQSLECLTFISFTE